MCKATMHKHMGEQLPVFDIQTRNNSFGQAALLEKARKIELILKQVCTFTADDVMIRGIEVSGERTLK